MNDIPASSEKEEPLIKKKTTEPDKGYKKDAYNESNFLSKLFFFWTFYILYLARKIKLVSSNLGTVSSSNDANNYSKNLSYYWNEKDYKSIKSNALFKAIFRANTCRLIVIIILSITSSAAEYIQVILTKEFIDTFEAKTDPSIKPLFNLKLYQIGIIFLSVQLFYTLLYQQVLIKQGYFGGRAACELNCFVYNKILNASPSSEAARSTQGEIINFIQIDSTQLNVMIQLCPNIIINPILIGAYIYLLFRFFGLTFFAGIGVLVISIFINYKTFQKYTEIKKKTLKMKDERMKATTETFDNIKVIKLYNWEKEFRNKIIDARERELISTRKNYCLFMLNNVLFWLCPTLVSIATIGVYQLVYDKFNIGTMLIGLNIFAQLQDPIRTLPNAVSSILETIVSMKRIENYIRQPDRDETVIHKGKYDSNGDYAIKINNGNFTWGYKPKKEEDKKELIPEEDDKKYDIVLKDISIEVKPGELVGIIGEVGCGKSSLLQAMLNSLILLNKEECDGIHINGDIGYVSQIPWIQNATIKDNILFFNDYDEHKYNKVIEMAQLNYDINNFEGGDNTEIGEKGINLSGGQKVRVALARVLYSNPDIYLFDDPISALDANIGKKIMKECICDYLKGKTRVVVTHALQYLKYMDRVIYINKGKIEWSGKYNDLLQQNFFEALRKLSGNDEDEEEENSSLIIDTSNKDTEKKVISDKPKKETKITSEEDREEGSVKMSIYYKYIKYNGGIIFLVLLLLIMLLWQAAKGGSDLWLAYWSEPTNQQSTSKNKKWIFFSIYSSLGISSILFIFFRLYLQVNGIIRLLRSLHTDMITNLLKAPINLFHDTVPRGQIYNRLSKDLDQVQSTIDIIGILLTDLLSVVGALVLCSIYDLYSLIFLPFMLIVGFLITSFALTGSRQLSRMSAIAKSPLLNIATETIPGSVSILSLNKKENYLRKFFNAVNEKFKVNVFTMGVILWFNLQFNLISLLYIIYLVVITILKENSFTSQSVAIMFTYSVVLQRYLGWFFNYCSDLENNMISMERCLAYTKIKEEKDFVKENDSTLIQSKWPQRGTVKFDNYSVRYRPNTEIVLKNISFNIKEKEKIGIVGRTGSGKSTICLCLFRILEPFQGKIFIDDVDISEVGLDVLRENITIIPQDPCLISGTMRYNIDPLSRSSDEEMNKILRDIGFEEENVLEKIIEENGNNLSVGEKQLVCIARAMIRKTKIVVIDEGTANIDMKTEEKIQHALSEILKEATIITIAHRIKTIINYDRILVLDNGEVKEFDTPDNLIHNEQSLFYELYSKSV